jgi:hypothetical protein
MWTVVAVAGLFASWLNPTAAALVISWLAGTVVYWITGNNLPIEFYLYPDIFVIAVIFAKREGCNLRPYRSTWHQLACVLLERSPMDRVVMLVFPVMWVIYGLSIPVYNKWYCLWALVLVQFAAAIYEAFVVYTRNADAVDETDTGHSGPLMFATGGARGRGYS